VLFLIIARILVVRRRLLRHLPTSHSVFDTTPPTYS